MGYIGLITDTNYRNRSWICFLQQITEIRWISAFIHNRIQYGKKEKTAIGTAVF